MSITIFAVGLLSAGMLFLIGGAVLAVMAARIASAGRAAQAEADVRLAASQELALQVSRLAEKVEMSLQSRDSSLENAFLRHNDACAASVQQAFAGKGGHHDDDDDHKHKKHHGDFGGKGGHHDDDDDHKHKKHHGAFGGKGGHHDDDDDHHKKKHHAVEGERPSLLARLFGRVY